MHILQSQKRKITNQLEITVIKFIKNVVDRDSGILVMDFVCLVNNVSQSAAFINCSQL